MPVPSLFVSRASIIGAFAVALAITAAACGDDSTSTTSTAPTPLDTAAVTPTTLGEPAPATSASPMVTVPPTTETSAGPSSPTTTEAGPITIHVVVTGGEVTGEERVVVERGADIELTVQSDTVDEVHIHGYDYKADVAPGMPAVIGFVADLPGVYEIELEDAGLLLMELEVR